MEFLPEFNPHFSFTYNITEISWVVLCNAVSDRPQNLSILPQNINDSFTQVYMCNSAYVLGPP